jgi:ABC-type transport system involved in cytochrome c biogenesis permease subunit
MIGSSSAARPSKPSRAFWLATIASLSIAVVVSLAVEVLWQVRKWPFPFSIALTSFFVVSGLLQSTLPNARRQSWRSRALFSLVLAIVLGGAYFLVMRA